MASHGTARDEMDGYNSSKKKLFNINCTMPIAVLWLRMKCNFFLTWMVFWFLKKLNLYKNILNYIVTLGGPLNCV